VHVMPSSLNNASSSILADQTVVSEDSHHADNIYDDMELHSTPLRTDTIHNSEAINVCVSLRADRVPSSNLLLSSSICPLTRAIKKMISYWRQLPMRCRTLPSKPEPPTMKTTW